MKIIFPVRLVIPFLTLGILCVAATAVAEKNDPGNAAAKLQWAQKKFGSIQDFDREAELARKNGIPEQSINELKLIWSIKLGSLDSLPATISNIEKNLDHWRESDPPVFSKKSALLGAVYVGKALLADRANNEADFEHAVKEAFWADPGLAEILTGFIESRETKKRLATLVMPLDLKLEGAAGTKTSLGELMHGQKALLLDFWASWCGPCMQRMAELKERAHTLAPQQVVVVGINVEASDQGGTDEAKRKAQRVKNDKKIDFAWILEPPDRPLSKLLDLDSLPTAVVVTPDGKVVFDGHPDDPALAEALNKMGINLVAQAKPKS